MILSLYTIPSPPIASRHQMPSSRPPAKKTLGRESAYVNHFAATQCQSRDAHSAGVAARGAWDPWFFLALVTNEIGTGASRLTRVLKILACSLTSETARCWHIRLHIRSNFIVGRIRRWALGESSQRARTRCFIGEEKKIVYSQKK
jgi:hypothetical protein